MVSTLQERGDHSIMVREANRLVIGDSADVLSSGRYSGCEYIGIVPRGSLGCCYLGHQKFRKEITTDNDTLDPTVTLEQIARTLNEKCLPGTGARKYDAKVYG